eukprot:Phypoly_transcript_10405.p1 GENE.Phypoly_transcript_10405~~Phypoly_transcript_10405.p1  ORF type:complete len:350 (+),score=26.02 Phypoly_transcript_10405:251-1300(+)
MRISRAVLASSYFHSRLTPKALLHHNFGTVPSPTLPPLSFENVELHWTTPKSDNKRDLSKDPIPSTRQWTSKELEFFKMHYCQVPPSSWKEFLCEEAPMTPVAQELTAMKLSLDEIMQGAYVDLPFYQRIFADTMYSIFQPDVTEAPTDDLVLFLLRACNPSTILVPEGKKSCFNTQVGECSFISIPDATVAVRLDPYMGPSLVVVEDRRKRMDELLKSPDYQLAGEMASAAVRNWNINRLPQTVFAIRAIGTRITYYRADFPRHYLQSVIAGTPVDDITIFRCGGSDCNSGDYGYSALEKQERDLLLQWTCSAMATCNQIALDVKKTPPKVSSITIERLKKLYPKLNM